MRINRKHSKVWKDWYLRNETILWELCLLEEWWVITRLQERVGEKPKW